MQWQKIYILSAFPPAFFFGWRGLLHNSAFSVLFCFLKYVEYSLVEITVWEQSKNVQDPQTALRNAGIFHGYLSSEEKGEEESESQNLQFTFKTSLPPSSSCLACVKHLELCSEISLETFLYVYTLGPGSSRWTITLMTTQSRTM